jgi:hypothetical protein
MLVLWSSAPPSELRIEGRSLNGMRGITLNGRDLPLVPQSGGGVQLIRGADWREITPRTVPVRVLLPAKTCSSV